MNALMFFMNGMVVASLAGCRAGVMTVVTKKRMDNALCVVVGRQAKNRKAGIYTVRFVQTRTRKEQMTVQIMTRKLNRTYPGSQSASKAGGLRNT
jgi:hypothetical protein